jgi:hypothetical protein
MSPEMLHVRVVLEECLWVLQPQTEVVLFVKLLVEGTERFVIFASLLCLYDGVDQTVDVGRNLIVTSEVNQAVHKLCMCEREILDIERQVHTHTQYYAQ